MYFSLIFFNTCSGRGFSEVKGPPGALCININEIMIKIRIVGIATPNLFKINLIIKDEKKKKHRTIGAFF